MRKLLILLLTILPVIGVAQKRIKVACIGNSVTYGMTHKNPAETSYPTQLQQMLGDKYEVRNFGHSGATLLNKGHRPYINLHEYKAALAFSLGIRYSAGKNSFAQEDNYMNNEYGPNFITLTDDDGNNIDLEYVDALEMDGQTYMAFFPVVEEGADEDADEYGLVILKSVMVKGEEMLSTLDSEEEAEKVYELFMEQLMEDEE